MRYYGCIYFSIKVRGKKKVLELLRKSQEDPSEAERAKALRGFILRLPVDLLREELIENMKTMTGFKTIIARLVVKYGQPERVREIIIEKLSERIRTSTLINTESRLDEFTYLAWINDALLPFITQMILEVKNGKRGFENAWQVIQLAILKSYTFASFSEDQLKPGNCLLWSDKMENDSTLLITRVKHKD